MCRRSGFTLIELLVVIAIIALLMAMLAPALSTAKRQTKAVICKHNLHEWAIVLRMYTLANNDLFMPHQALTRKDAPHLYKHYKNEKLLLCPMAVKDYNEGARNPFAAHFYYNGLASYGINTWICSEVTANFQTDDRMWKTPNVKEAPYVPMMFDCAGYQNASPWDYDNPPAYDGEFITSSSIDEMKYVCLNRHSEHMNMAFVDWHVEKIGLKRLWTLKWNRKFDTKGPWTTAGGVTPNDWPVWMRHMRDY